MSAQRRTYQDLSEETIVFLTDESAATFQRDFSKKHGVEKLSKLIILIDGIVLGSKSLNDLPQELESIGVSPENAKAAAIELAQNRFLPLDAIIGNVASAITSWGGSAKGEAKNVMGETDPMLIIKAELEKLEIREDTPVIQHRLEKIIFDYITGVFTKEDAVMKLTRPQKVGGLGMEGEDADLLLTQVKEETKEYAWTRKEQVSKKPAPKKTMDDIKKVVKERKEEKVVKEEKEVKVPKDAKVKESKEPTQDKPPTKDATPTEDEVPTISDPDEDLHKDLAEAAKKIEEFQVKKGQTIEQILEALMRQLTVNLKADQMGKFKKIADSRIRGVRNAYQTRGMLERGPQKGGLGLKGIQLADTMDMLEQAARSYQDLNKKKIVKKKQVEDGRKEMKVVKDGAKVAKGAKIEKKTARLSPGSLVPKRGGKRLDDIRGSRKLMGPVEEIQALSLTGFRRLSTDPQSAKTKLLDKIQLLEDQGYQKKVAAVKAWRKSPLHLIYTKLTKEALMAGMTVEAYVEQKGTDNEDFPSVAEVKEIMALNGLLRF